MVLYRMTVLLVKNKQIMLFSMIQPTWILLLHITLILDTLSVAMYMYK